MIIVYGRAADLHRKRFAVRSTFIIIFLLQFPHKGQGSRGAKQCFENIHRIQKGTRIRSLRTKSSVLYMQDKSSRADSDIEDGNRNGVISWPPLTLWNWNWAWTPFPAKKQRGSEIKKGI